MSGSKKDRPQSLDYAGPATANHDADAPIWFKVLVSVISIGFVGILASMALSDFFHALN
ncbi:MAG TPA: hypothetical protein P5081_15875 [Phycisphaerae bacterium]|nr:hypothetical protein [Phycisphaerae bacterium]HRW54350.1 hypothetical protein [Phycisphaerae bacterium]